MVTEPTLSGFSDLKRVMKVVNYFDIPWRLVINKWDINQTISKRIENWASKISAKNRKDIVLGKISFDKKIFQAISNLKPVIKTNLPAKKEILKIFSDLKNII